MKSLLILLAASCLFSQRSFAQDTNEIATKKTTVTLMPGIIYAPGLHYFGRTDELKSSALLPTLLVQFDSVGLYASGTSVFLNNKLQTLDYAGTIAEAGYRFGKLKGLAGNIYGNKFFYNSTQLPQSALEAQAGINLTWQSKLINFTGSGNAAFSDKTDFFIAGGLNRRFISRKGKNIFVITPAAIVNAGTRNYTRMVEKPTTLPLPGNTVTTTENITRFKVLDYELSTSLVWARKNIFVILSPTYVIPQNLVTIEGHPELSEKGSNLFYANISLLYSIKK